MYTGRLWTMRQYAGFGTAQETNRRFRQLLAAGQMGLSTAFDLPTQMGYDSDHPMAQGEVGRVGVAIDTVEDLAELFREIPLDRVSTSMTINATAAILLAMYVVVGEEQGVPRAKLTGTVQNDVLKEYIARGTYIYPAAALAPAGGRHLPLRRRRRDELQSDLDQRLPHARGGRDRGAGGRVHPGQRAGVRAGSRWMPGSTSDSFGPRLSFFFASHNDLFEEAAKFRAARRLWARLVRERFGAGDGTARLRFHTQTGGVTLQAQQPLNNVVRVTVPGARPPCWAAPSRSTPTGTTRRWRCLPTESATLALRTQQMLGYESGVAEVVDPLGGSYYVECAHRPDRARSRALIVRRWTPGRRGARRSSAASSRRPSRGAPTSCRRRRSRASGSWSASTGSPTTRPAGHRGAQLPRARGAPARPGCGRQGGPGRFCG